MTYNIELTSEEIQVIQAALDFIADGNIGFEALEGYIDDDIDAWEVNNSLTKKFI